jgi:hypothetical protein
MHQSTQNFTQVQTVFGGGYVPDNHGDDMHHYLPPAEKHEFIVDFEAVINALRAALSLR